MILEKDSKNRSYLQISPFKIDDEVDHLFSTRIGWNQKNIIDDLSDVFSINKSLVYSATQVHGIEVEIITDQDVELLAKKPRDGLITSKRGIVLATYHADCVPIYFYDRVKKVIGMAHSGWKGTLNNISKVMIDSFQLNFESNLNDIIVAIGPSIGSCCYEIGHDVESLFRERFPDEDNIVLFRNEKMYLDLWKTNKINLLNTGIKDENIIESLFCTSCNTDILYSYRKENTKNRMIGAITLRL